ncbi:TRAF3IP1 family protein [Megaselia abdita]
MSGSSELDSEIKKTQETLGKFVKKPALTEKLLKKPPFRFLHDVISAVIRDTGNFKSLYTPEELKSDNIKDREAKIAFLQKIIDVVKQVSNDPPLAVKPSKIVAGHEPEQTNRLLQRIAFIISNKINTSPVTNSETPKTKPKKDESPTKPRARKSSDPKIKVTRTSSKDAPEPKKAKSRTLSKDDKTSQDKKPKKIEKQKTIKDTEPINSLESSNGNFVGNGNSVQEDSSLEPQDARKRKKSIQQDSSMEKETSSQENQEVRKKSGERKPSSGNKKSDSDDKKPSSGDKKPSSGDRKSSSGDRKSSSGESRKSSAEKKSEERKSSARNKSSVERNLSIPEEPLQENSKIEVIEKMKESPEKFMSNSSSNESPKKVEEEPTKNIDSKERTQVPPPLTRQNSILSRPRTSLRPPSARPPSARPGAPRRRDKSIEIVLQPNEPTKVGGINVKVESFNSELEDDGENLIVIENSNIEEDVLGSKHIDQMIIDDEEHQQGHLVQQILETQKELVQGDKSDIEKALKERKNRQTSATQIDSLRGLIQTLTKAVNPTGKLLDFIPEDVDSMQLELTMWRDTYSQAAAELKREKSLTETATEPLKNQLSQLDQQIKEYKEMIESSRAKILQNSEKIRSLLIED